MSTVARFGGKGFNLERLRAGGFPVPSFAVLDVDEYHAFVEAQGLGDVIAAAHTCEAAAASETIRAAFRRPLPAGQRDRILELLGDLVDRPVAVRSSATAEDLPEASFAGQQDTFLDVVGVDAVLDAIVECWSSLWTERAITYRRRNGVASEGLGLAVVVQEQVFAEASGVVFTADPLTGRRDRVVVDAVHGLGEKLVSGQVVPDHFEVDGTAVVRRDVHGDDGTLSDAQLLDLVALCRRVAEAFGAPQDIEFTRVGDELKIVQARAITSLFPLPEGPRDGIWFSFGAVQGVLGPLTPLGRSFLEEVGRGAASVVAGGDLPASGPFVTAGERLWIRVDRMLTGPGRRLLLGVLSFGEPTVRAIVMSLLAEGTWVPRDRPGARRALARPVLSLAPTVAARVARAVADPDATRAAFVARTDARVADVEASLLAAAQLADPQARLARRVEVVRAAMRETIADLLPRFAPVVPPAVGMSARVRALAARSGVPGAQALAVSIFRSLPDNVTTRMDLALYAAARRIAADPDSAEAFAADPEVLADRYLAGRLPPVAADAVRGFLAEYGMRGVAEIDVGAPRWREAPEQVLRTIRTYLSDADHAASYEEGRGAAERAVDTLARGLSRGAAAELRFFAGRARGLLGLRETPKFTLVRILGAGREALLESGRDLVAAGRLDEPTDIAFLSASELAGAFTDDVRARVSERQALRAREERRSRVPLVLVGDGRAFYSAPSAATGGADLSGSGVSPGVATGAVRVVDDPATSELQPGEILVCRGTDPAWTPLFLTAAGLVTEVGGLMTHGSVVAREYGLPAVVGVPEATTRLRNGQRVRLDGARGSIEIVDATDTE